MKLRRWIAAVAFAVIVLSGCGSSGHASAPRTLPPPGEAERRTIEGMPEEVSIACSYAQVGGQEGSTDGSLIHFVAEVESIARRTDISSLSAKVREVIHDLDQTNAFNKPTCAPALGERLSAVTGIKTEGES
jgi:hypothetical protein